MEVLFIELAVAHGLPKMWAQVEEALMEGSCD